MGRREDNAKKAVELMKDQKLIRNLGTAAHIDHGKSGHDVLGDRR